MDGKVVTVVMDGKVLTAGELTAHLGGFPVATPELVEVVDWGELYEVVEVAADTLRIRPVWGGDCPGADAHSAGGGQPMREG